MSRCALILKATEVALQKGDFQLLFITKRPLGNSPFSCKIIEPSNIHCSVEHKQLLVPLTISTNAGNSLYRGKSSISSSVVTAQSLYTYLSMEIFFLKWNRADKKYLHRYIWMYESTIITEGHDLKIPLFLCLSKLRWSTLIPLVILNMSLELHRGEFG